MTQMTSFSPPHMANAPMPIMAGDPGTAADSRIRLKRMGQRPLEFSGEELCFAMSFVPGAPFWFEVNVWRRFDGGFVSAVKLFYRDADRIDICRAWTSSAFEEVLDTLESFDAVRDLEADADLSADMTLVELTASAMSLRAWAAEARRQYAALVGELLDELEHG